MSAVQIEKLATGYIVSVAEKQPRSRQQEPQSAWGLLYIGTPSEPEVKVTRYACKSLYEVAGLLEQLFTDSAFLAKDVALCGDVVKKERQAKLARTNKEGKA